MKTVCIIQARMGSSRLPGKTLKNIAGIPCIYRVIKRVKKAKLINEIWIATTRKDEDIILEKIAKELKVFIFKGSINNVLSRFYKIATLSKGTTFVRITADCPLIDKDIIDKAISVCIKKKFDYVSNTIERTFPDGLDVEVFSREALFKAQKNANHPFLKEHVTPYIHGQVPKAIKSGNFKKYQIKNRNNYSNFRWTLDMKEDLTFLNKLCKKTNLYSNWTTIKSVILKNPYLLDINNKIKTNEASKKSLQQYLKKMKNKDFTNSKRLFNRALNTIPMASQTFSKSYLQWPVNISPLFLKKGKGCLITDVDNNEYIDYLLALLPIVTGYADRDIDKNVKKQIDKGVILSLSHPLEIELSEMLAKVIPYAEMVKFGKNGSDALSAAVRVARATTKKNMIAVCGYHGWHDWFIGTTNRNLGIPSEVKNLTKTFSFNNIQSFISLIKKYKNSFAAVIVEPETIIKTDKKFLKYLRDYCNKNNSLLVFDEVICGFRCQMGGASKKHNIQADLGCFGKSMANGYPLSALVGKKKYMKIMEDIFVSGTFSGDILSIAAAIATIKKLQRFDVIKKINKHGIKLTTMLNNIIDENNLIDQVCFEGNDWWPRLNIKTKKIDNNLFLTLLRQELISNNLFLGSSLNLCLAHCNEKIYNQTISRFSKTIKNFSKYISVHNPESYLKGSLVSSVFKIR